MAIPLKERTKVNQLVGRIQASAFDATDVDGVLIKLRPYAGNRKVFREVTDFVAHADARNKGLTCESMTAFADAMRFFVEYTKDQRPLNVSQPFPVYIHRLFLSQAKLSDEAQLRFRYKLSHSSLTKKIESNFSIDKATKTCSLRPGKGGPEFIGALQYVVGFIHSRPAFRISEFHTQFKQVLRDGQITLDEAAWDAQCDRISLAVLCLIAGTEVLLPEGDKAKCRLECANHFRILEGKRRLPIGSVTAEPSSFGPITMRGEISLPSTGQAPIRMTYPIITTDLDPHVHCAPELFMRATEQNEFGQYSVEAIDFCDDMALTGEFKLIRADKLQG